MTYRRPIPKPVNADSAWLELVRCTAVIGVTELPGHGLAEVKWFETTEWERQDSIAESGPVDDHVMLGAWIEPDTILIARRSRVPTGKFMVGSQYFGWVVMHELLHHLLQGPPKETHFSSVHPFVPFSYPCKVNAWQHIGEWDRLVPGGRQ